MIFTGDPSLTLDNFMKIIIYALIFHAKLVEHLH